MDRHEYPTDGNSTSLRLPLLAPSAVNPSASIVTLCRTRFARTAGVKVTMVAM